MNNYEIEQRIKELEQEIKFLKAECVDPMQRMRHRREEVLINEGGFPKHVISSSFGGPMLALIRNTACISPETMKRIDDKEDIDLFFSMQDELLSVVVKYSNAFKDRKKQLASVNLDDLYSAARKYKRAKQLGRPMDGEGICFRWIYNSFINAGYTKEELNELLAENT